AGREILQLSVLPLCPLTARPPHQQINLRGGDADNDDNDEEDSVINLHGWDADNDDNVKNDRVVGTATIALTDLIKGGGEDVSGSDTQIREVVGHSLTHGGKKTGAVSMEMEVGYTSFSGPGESHPALPTHPSFEPLPILQSLLSTLPTSAAVPKAGSKSEAEAAAYGLTLPEQQAVEALFAPEANAATLAAWENLSQEAAGEQQEFFKSAFECVCFLSSGNSDTQVGVWRDKDPRRKRLVVSFRGTEVVNAAMLKDGQAGQKIKDALTDLRLHKENFDSDLTDEDNKMDIKVHDGFLDGYKSVKPRLLLLLKAILASSSGKYHIMVTGHSLGGALSTLFTYDLAQSDLKKQHGFNLSLYNFGSPRVGNHAFAARFNQLVGDSWRIANDHDIVPRVPYVFYKHVATGVVLRPDSQKLEKDALLKKRLDTITTVSFLSEQPKLLFDGAGASKHSQPAYFLSLLKVCWSSLAAQGALVESRCSSKHSQPAYFLSLLKVSWLVVVCWGEGGLKHSQQALTAGLLPLAAQGELVGGGVLG
ncbi:unnamed protein product, partial [Closterium sp. Naga37s-1]